MNQSPANSAATEQHDFKFTGNGGEFFRIWIVNILLSIITLGIYSAWAKVRTNRYMYGNTEVAGDHFEYLAEPMQILRGRLIAIAFFAVYFALATFSPGVELILLLVLALASPWIITRSLAFRARMTSYRNIQFRFLGTTWQATREFILMPLLIIPTLGLIMPYIRYRQMKFITSHHSYGTSRFGFSATAGNYYNIFLVAIGLSLVALIFAALLMGGTAVLAGLSGGADGEPELGAGAFTIAINVLMFYLVFGLIGTYVKTMETNLMMKSLHTKGVSFNSELKVLPLFWLYLSNLLLTAITLGLFYPWAIVRLHRYRAQCTALTTTGDLSNFVAASQEERSAMGEELGEVFDVDFAL